MWHVVSGGLDVEFQAGVEAEAAWHVRALLSPLGAITQMCQLHAVRFEVPAKEKGDAHAQTRSSAHVRMEKERSRGRWKFHMCASHTTAPWIIELSCSSWSTLWCAHRVSLTCQTLRYTHTYMDTSFFVGTSSYSTVIRHNKLYSVSHYTKTRNDMFFIRQYETIIRLY